MRVNKASIYDYVIVGDGKLLKGPSEAGPGQVVYDLYRLTH